MIWQDKGYTLVSIIEISIGFLALFMMIKMLISWLHPKYQKTLTTFKWFNIIILIFDAYLLLDKLGYLTSLFIKAVEHFIMYSMYDYTLLILDAMCTIGLIISTGIFAKSVIKFYNHVPDLEAPDYYTLQIMRKIAKSFRWLILIFAGKDLLLGVIANIIHYFTPVHYVVYASSYMTITFVFMLILFVTIKVFIDMYKEALKK